MHNDGYTVGCERTTSQIVVFFSHFFGEILKCIFVLPEIWVIWELVHASISGYPVFGYPFFSLTIYMIYRKRCATIHSKLYKISYEDNKLPSSEFTWIVVQFWVVLFTAGLEKLNVKMFNHRISCTFGRLITDIYRYILRYRDTEIIKIYQEFHNPINQRTSCALLTNLVRFRHNCVAKICKIM